MSIEIRPTDTDDIPDIAKVLSQATLHKSEQGDYLWGNQPYTTEDVEAKIRAGGLYTVIYNGLISGTVIVTDKDQRIWNDSGEDQEALYVHQLATSDEARGQNLGGQIIDWVADKAKKDGRRSIRLDCSYTNQRLYDYYKSRGFIEVARRDIPRKNTARDLRDPIYKVALLQRDIT